MESKREGMRRSATYGSPSQRSLHIPNIPRRHPALRNQRLPPLIPPPQVQRREDDLLLPHQRPPCRNALCDLEQLGAASLVRVVEDAVEVFDAGGNFTELGLTLVGGGVDGEEGGTHGCARNEKNNDSSVSARGGQRERHFVDAHSAILRILSRRS
jgi:hypothetical protein